MSAGVDTEAEPSFVETSYPIQGMGSDDPAGLPAQLTETSQFVPAPVSRVAEAPVYEFETSPADVPSAELGGENLLSVSRPTFSDNRWTRMGGPRIDGDPVTENYLADLADRAEKAARAQGFSAGWGEGKREAARVAEGEEARRQAEHQQAEARRNEEHLHALRNLAAAAEAMHRATAMVSAEMADRAIDVATGLTRQLVHHELIVAQSPGLDAVRAALALAPEAQGITLRLCPSDAADVASALPDGTVRIVTDLTMTRGDVLMEFDDGAVDLRVSQALERVCGVLEQARDDEHEVRSLAAQSAIGEQSLAAAAE